MTESAFAISVVVPTFNRRMVLEKSLEALEAEGSTAPFEVIVVCDGSTDGSAAMVRSRSWAMPVSVIEQRNSGSAAARNRGALASKADIVLFVDDDMRAGEKLIDAHLRAHTTADVVVGRMVHDHTSPATILALYVEEWLSGRHAELSAFGGSIPGVQILSGHVSVKSALFHDLRGFDESFNEGGRYGNEDIDFGERLVSSGAAVRYEPTAVSAQYFCVRARTKFQQARDLGAMDVRLEHSALGANDLVQTRRREWSVVRNLILDRLSSRWPGLIFSLVFPHRRLSETLIDRGWAGDRIHRWFGMHQALAYRVGVADGRAQASSHATR